MVAEVSGPQIPWGIALAPDGTMLFTERGGTLNARLPEGTVRAVAADFTNLFASGETGLMAIVVDPGFGSSRRFYTCQGHTGPGPGNGAATSPVPVAEEDEQEQAEPARFADVTPNNVHAASIDALYAADM